MYLPMMGRAVDGAAVGQDEAEKGKGRSHLA